MRKGNIASGFKIYRNNSMHHYFNCEMDNLNNGILGRSDYNFNTPKNPNDKYTNSMASWQENKILQNRELFQLHNRDTQVP